MKNSSITALLFILPLLIACGETTGDRAISGAGIGAGGGAAVAAIAGGNPLAGALIGGAAGGATGALTSPDQINLGKAPGE